MMILKKNICIIINNKERKKEKSSYSEISYKIIV